MTTDTTYNIDGSTTTTSVPTNVLVDANASAAKIISSSSNFVCGLGLISLLFLIFV